MNILFDIGHPAHVHLFKNLIIYLNKDNENNIEIVTRKKDIIEKLLRHYKFDFKLLSIPKKTKFGMMIELLQRDFKIWELHKKHNFKYAIGTSVSIGHLSKISKVISYNFNEDDDNIVPLYAKISYPFSTKIINPDCLKFSKWKDKRILHNSYHELAYLHPNNFNPDVNILKKYNLEANKYIVIRYSALDAHHDKGVKGLRGNVWKRIEEKIKDYPKVISTENEKSHQIEPWDMHHILAFAKLVISDSQTMTAEAAVLGIPSIRYNSFVGKISYLEELEHKYKLTYGFLPDRDEDKLLLKLSEILKNNAKTVVKWKKRREKMLEDKVDLNQWMIDFFEQEKLNKLRK